MRIVLHPVTITDPRPSLSGLPSLVFPAYGVGTSLAHKGVEFMGLLVEPGLSSAPASQWFLWQWLWNTCMGLGRLV